MMLAIFLSLISPGLSTFSPSEVLPKICKERFEVVIDFEMKSRAISYMAKKPGLDYIESISECRFLDNTTYALFTWGKNRMNLIGFGFCMPEQCKDYLPTYLNSSYSEIISIIPSQGHNLLFYDFKAEVSLSPVKVFFASMFAILMIITIYSTCINPKSSSNLIKSFELRSNIRSVFKIEPEADGLEFFDGIRAICSGLILCLHIYIFFNGMPLNNRREYEDSTNTLFLTWVRSFNSGVDLFFYIAGFLMAILVSRDIVQKGKNFSLIKCIIRRLARYLPVYLFVIGVDRCFVKPVPANSRSVISYLFLQAAQEGWWKNLIFVQNIFTNGKSTYLPWTWTISADFHFYVISIFVVYLYSKHKSLAYFSALILFFISFCYSYWAVCAYDVYPVNESHQNMLQFGKIYISTLARLNPFVIGVLFGFLYLASKKKTSLSVAYEVRDGLADRFEKKILALFRLSTFRKGMYFIGGLLMFSVFIVPAYSEYYGKDSFGIHARATYYATYKFIYGVGFGLIAFPLSLGYWKELKSILSGRLIRILGKISFCFYLIHPFVFVAIVARGDEMLEGTKVEWIKWILIIYPASVIAAGILFALIELPMQSAIRIILAR